MCDDGRGPTPADVANSIAIFRSRYSDRAGRPVAGKMLRSDLRVRWIFVDWRRDAWGIVRHVEAYRRYPQVIRTEKNSGAMLGSPPYFAVAVDVASQMTIPVSAAFDMPLIRLYCIRAALTELAGGPVCAWRRETKSDEIADGLKLAQAAIAQQKAVSNG